MPMTSSSSASREECGHPVNKKLSRHPNRRERRCCSPSMLSLLQLVVVPLLLLIDMSHCREVLFRDQQPQQAHLPPGVQHDSLVDPFLQQQRWLSARPFQEYRRPQSDELGLLLQYLDNKRNAPSAVLLDDEGGSGGRHAANGSPLGTMRFGKRRFNSPLGTMRFG